MLRSIKATLSLIAVAALVGSVAQAECPSFNSALPSVIVTPNDTFGNDDSLGLTFNDAFDVLTYIDLGTSASSVDGVFAQFAVGGSSPQSGGAAIYTINGISPVASIPTTAAAITGAGSKLDTSVESLLSFENISSGPTTGAASERTLTLFVVAPSSSAACSQDAEIALASFNIITQLTGPDELTAPSCNWTTVYDDAGNLSDWADLNFGTGITLTASAANLQFAITSGATGFGALFRILPTFQADTVYELRMNMQSTATSGNNEWFRTRLGNPSFSMDAGSLEQGFTQNGTAYPTTARDVVQYFQAKETGTGPSASGGFDTSGIALDIIDTGASAAAYTTQVNSVVLRSTTPDCLGVGTVVWDYGRATVSNNDGFAPPASAPTAFGATWTKGMLLDLGGASSVTSNWSTLGPLGVGSVDGQGSAFWTVTSSLVNSNDLGFGTLFGAGGDFTANLNRVYVLDAWISSNEAPNNTTARFPVLRLRFNSAEVTNGQRETGHFQIPLGPDRDFEGSEPSDNQGAITAANSARHYRAIFKPNYNPSFNLGTGVAIDFLFNRTDAIQIRPNGQLTIERLTLREYVDPAF